MPPPRRRTVSETSNGSAATSQGPYDNPSLASTSGSAFLDVVLNRLNAAVPASLHRSMRLIRELDDALLRLARDKRAKDKKALSLLIAETKESLALQTYELLDEQISVVDRVLARVNAVFPEHQRALSASGANGNVFTLPSHRSIKKRERNLEDRRRASSSKKRARSSLHEESSVSLASAGEEETSGTSSGASSDEDNSSDDEEESSSTSSGSSESSSSTSSSSSISSQEERAKRRLEERKRLSGGGTINMDVDPNEPTYCVCGQVAFGEMIACDNPSCVEEWFHVQCVGKPNSEGQSLWMCPNCVRSTQQLQQQ